MSDIITLFGDTQMQVIVILIGVDVILGIIAALVRKDFVFSRLAEFMKGPVLAYVFGFAVIKVVGQALPRLSFLVLVVFVLVGLTLLASIIRNLGRLGLPLPGVLKR